MLDMKKLRAAMAMQGYNARMLCKEIGMVESTFSMKCKRGIFNSDEIVRICEVLNVDDPAPIFLNRQSLEN